MFLKNQSEHLELVVSGSDTIVIALASNIRPRFASSHQQFLLKHIYSQLLKSQK